MSLPVLRPMPLINPVHRFVLFTNAKCGGTSMKAWFVRSLQPEVTLSGPVAIARHYGMDFLARCYSRNNAILRVADERKLLQADQLRQFIDRFRRFYSARHLEALESPDFLKVAVVRDPCQRVVSAFVDKFCGPDRRHAFVRSVLEAAGRSGAITFASFLDYLAEADEHVLDPHWRRQTYLLEHFRFDRLLALEHLNEELSKLASELGLPESCRLPRERLKTNAYAAVPSSECFANATNLELIRRSAAGEGFPSKADFLDPASLAKIEQIYRRDFELLGYASSCS